MKLSSLKEAGISSRGDAYFLTLSKNLLLLDKGLEIIREFENNNIDYLVLKGLYLAFSAYPDAGLRSMADIDLLIKREDLDKVDIVLARLGYIESSAKAQRVYGCDATFSGKDATSVDIHWNLCQYERFKGVINITQDFWSRAQEYSLNGAKVRSLCAEDHILYVALHYALVHVFSLPNGAYDLSYLLNDNKLDWGKIINNASKYGIKTTLYYGLLKASQLNPLMLPDFVLRRLKPNFLKRKLLDWLLKHNSRAGRYLCQSLFVDNLFDSFKVLCRLVKAARTRYNKINPAIFSDTPTAIRV